MAQPETEFVHTEVPDVPGVPDQPVETVQRPSFTFFSVLASLALILDVGSKAWADIVLNQRSPIDRSLTIIEDHLSFTLAYNRGGAWGLAQNASDGFRRPFFYLVSAAAVLFIVSLYSRLVKEQRALTWGLPLVFGGALGNLTDRIMRGSVVDFIDYNAEWVRWMNELIAMVFTDWHVTAHWPTFNVADIAICIGVGLMAVDMFASSKTPAAPTAAES